MLAAVNEPGEKLVAFYRGRVFPCPSGLMKISGKWFITLPGCRAFYSVFFISSQPFACKDPRRMGVGNPSDANCRLVWYKKSYGPEDTLGPCRPVHYQAGPGK